MIRLAETTDQYKNRISQIKTSIENEPEIVKMREDIAEGISKTGNRQADIEVRQGTLEEDFVKVQQDASSVSPSGAEVAVARGEYSTLDGRLTAEQNKVNAQLAQTDDDYNKLRGLGTFFDKLNKGESATLICFGDSTTLGENVTQNFVDRLSAYVQITLGYGSLATIINAGVGGDTTEKGFNRLAESVLNKKPDAVIINFGINDVGQGVSTETSMKFYRYIIEHIIAFCDSDIIVRTNNISRNVNDMNVYDEYNRAVEKVANEYKVVFADYYNFMKKQNYTQEDLLLYFLDGIHPNDSGYELMFSFMKQFIVPSILKKGHKNVAAIDLRNKKNATTDLPLSQSVKFGWSNYFGHHAAKKVVIKFYGNGLKWSFTRSNSAGKVKITSDGTIIENELDLYQKDVLWNSIYEISYNENKVHEVVIEFLGIKNELSTNSNVLMGGFIASFDDAGFYAFNIEEQISSQHMSGKNIIRDSSTGVLLQSGYASCDKGGSVILPIPYKSAYNVICTQSGNGGGVGDTHEPIYFSSSADYALTAFYPRWDSQDTKKGINWIAFGI